MANNKLEKLEQVKNVSEKKLRAAENQKARIEPRLSNVSDAYP